MVPLSNPQAKCKNEYTTNKDDANQRHGGILKQTLNGI